LTRCRFLSEAEVEVAVAEVEAAEAEVEVAEAQVAEAQVAEAQVAEAQVAAYIGRARRQTEQRWNIRGRGRRQRWRDASEAVACIRMHRKSMEVDGADRADGASSKYKVSEAVKMVRTCQNSLGQDGTCLGLLLLHVGPNGDEFGGQAFMEHYTAQPQ
jgi:hypothetical protein